MAPGGRRKVINLNPVTGMATLYYEPKEKQDGGDAPKEEGEKKVGCGRPRSERCTTRRASPTDVEMTDATEEPAKDGG